VIVKSSKEKEKFTLLTKRTQSSNRDKGKLIELKQFNNLLWQESRV
jgi:hypothetical protein